MGPSASAFVLGATKLARALFKLRNKTIKTPFKVINDNDFFFNES